MKYNRTMSSDFITMASFLSKVTEPGLTLTFESLVALLSTPVANLPQAINFTSSRKGK